MTGCLQKTQKKKNSIDEERGNPVFSQNYSFEQSEAVKTCKQRARRE
jgi:hypothetical protein